MVSRLACLLLGSVSLAACTVNTSTPTALADIQTPTVEIHSSNDPSAIYGPTELGSLFEVRIDDGDCVRIADDVTATLDATPLGSVSRGGWEDTLVDGTCRGATFSFVGLPATTRSRLVIRDKTATWTISAAKLFANDFELQAAPGSPGQVTWDSASTIDQADAQLTDANGVLVWSSFNYDDTVPRAAVSIGGNGFSISAPVPSTGVRTLAVSATRTGTAESCDGPAACTVEVRAGREFALE